MPARFFISAPLAKLLPLAAVLAVFVAAPAFAQEDDEPNELQKVFGAIGLLDLPKAPIDYSERSPLVVPPSDDLPKPGDTADMKKVNPAWPVDQDVKDARKRAKEASKPIDAPTDAFYSGRNLRSNEWGKATSKSGIGDLWTDNAKVGNDRISSKELGFKGWGKKDEMKFEKEPERTSLLQPPAGYQTPSPNAPYGVVEEDKNILPVYAKDRNDERNQR